MKVTALLTLALAAGIAPATQAQTIGNDKASVTVYGILDAGVARVEHTQDFSAYYQAGTVVTPTNTGKASALGVYNGGLSSSRLGFKGEAILSGDLKAIFTLEAGINLPNGNVNNSAISIAQSAAAGSTITNDGSTSGQLFARGAYFGFASNTWGTLTVGRTQGFGLDLIPSYDAVQGAALFTPIGFSGSFAGGGYTDDSRVDTSLKYVAKFGDVNFGYLHGFGGVAGATSAQSSNQLNLGYEHGPFGIQVIYEAFSDAFSLSSAYTAAVAATTTPVLNATTNKVVTLTTPAVPAASGVKATFADTTATLVLARYKVTPSLLITAGYENQVFSAPSNYGKDATITSLYSQPVFATAVFTTAGNKTQKVSWIAAGYDLTTSLNVAIGYYKSSFSAFATSATATTAAGNSNYKSLLIDYRLAKSVDLYAGYMGSVSGGSSTTATSANGEWPNNAVTGVGARFKF